MREFVRCKFGYELEGDLFDMKSPRISESQDFTSSDIHVKMVKSGSQTSLHEDIKVENVQDEMGNDSDIDEDIPLPPLESPQFILWTVQWKIQSLISEWSLAFELNIKHTEWNPKKIPPFIPSQWFEQKLLATLIPSLGDTKQ